MAPEHWALYQRGMRSLANAAASETLRRTPVPPNARALRPGGYAVIQQGIRMESPNEGSAATWLLNLYFALTSNAGTWSYAEMAAWQSAAGLKSRKPIKFLLLPGVGEQVAVKPT